MPPTSASYHHITSYNRFEMKGHRLDWTNRPAVYKIYRGLNYLPLPHPMNLPRVPLNHLADTSGQKFQNRQALTIDRLATILALSYGITGRTLSGGETFYYRSAPSAGALYPVEIYLAADNIEGVPPGLYHYDGAEHRLCQLRTESIISFADTCIGKDNTDPPPHLCIFFSAIIFRSAWKYKERAFRYLLLDTGHVLENLLMTLRADELPATVHYDIHGGRTNLLLGVDPKREICFACVRIAGDKPPDPDTSKEPAALPRNIIDTGRVASKEVFFREIEEMASATSILPPHGRPSSDMINHLGFSPGSWKQIVQPLLPDDYYFSDAVSRRRSRRNFIPDELPGDLFFKLLTFMSIVSEQEQSTTHSPGSAVATGVLVQNVKDVAPGFYLCDFQNNRWGQIRPGLSSGAVAAACLNQQWLQNAAMHFCFLADLDQLDWNWGPRGYQYAMLDAGRLAQRIYLAATALGIGCCGIGALYDNEARELLGLNQSSALLYLVAAGPVKR